MSTRLLILSLILNVLTISAQDVYQSERNSWLEKAEKAKPTLIETIHKPISIVRSVADPSAFQGWRMEKSGEADELKKTSFKKKKEVTLDFGKHLTGYYSFRLKITDRAQDAPVRLKFTFGEVPAELNTSFDPYPGTLSRAWLQDEIITIPLIDAGEITIPRRLSFRYVKIELLAHSNDFDFVIDDMTMKAVSSVKEMEIPLAPATPQIIRDINRISLETLKECMQTVYEDGPKRDMRLWIGDLYLEALANTYSYKNHDLTKRCLYLIAGVADEDGRLHANAFENPRPHPQYGTYCLDYSLLYNVALLDYVKTTGDKEVALDVWPVVKNQIKESLSYLTDNYIFDQYKKGDTPWLVFDWRDELDRTTPMQGLMIFALNRSYELAKLINKETDANDWPEIAKKMKNAARKEMYDAKKGVFFSGKKKQVSYLSQAWMILSDVLTEKEGKKALETAFTTPDVVYPGAPYAYHYVIEAMVKCGMNKEAKEYLINYWGDMVNKGADTFWEVYDPNNEFLSPYLFFPVNSYCHAWSCTPVYFIGKYPDIFQK